MRRQGIGFATVLLLFFMGGWIFCAEAAPQWRVEDREFHKKDRLWQKRDGDPEALWRKKDRHFFQDDSRWQRVTDRKFMDTDRSWIREEQSL